MREAEGTGHANSGIESEEVKHAGGGGGEEIGDLVTALSVLGWKVGNDGLTEEGGEKARDEEDREGVAERCAACLCVCISTLCLSLSIWSSSLLRAPSL